MIIAERIRSNFQIALDTLRANKLRSSLTILGVVIGVSTVMTMAAIVQGIQDQIGRTIEIAGLGAMLLLSAMMLAAGTYNPFIYFRF